MGSVIVRMLAYGAYDHVTRKCARLGLSTLSDLSDGPRNAQWFKCGDSPKVSKARATGGHVWWQGGRVG